jgi:hypothetical protein
MTSVPQQKEGFATKDYVERFNSFIFWNYEPLLQGHETDSSFPKDGLGSYAEAAVDEDQPDRRPEGFYDHMVECRKLIGGIRAPQVVALFSFGLQKIDGVRLNDCLDHYKAAKLPSTHQLLRQHVQQLTLSKTEFDAYETQFQLWKAQAGWHLNDNYVGLALQGRILGRVENPVLERMWQEGEEGEDLGEEFCNQVMNRSKLLQAAGTSER